jgi:hypothetical protein
MSHARRVSRRLGSTTAVASVLVAAAVLAPAHAQPNTIVSVKLSSTALGAQSTTSPVGAVGGVRSPVEAGSTLNLTINASDTGAGLVSAHASIGANNASVVLCPVPASAGGKLGSACPENVSEVPLSINVGEAGSRVLLVTVTDAEGHVGTLVDQTVEVLAPQAPGSNTLTIGISNGRVGPHGEPLAEEPPRNETLGYKELQSPAACPSPMLTMRLASRPLGHTRRHVTVLRAGRRYRFTGRLTCQHGRRRVSAPDGTAVRVLYKRHHCAHGQTGCRVRWRERTITVRKGRLRVRLRFSFRDTIIFRYRPGRGESVQVRIRVAVRHVRRSRSCSGYGQRHAGACRHAGRQR